MACKANKPPATIEQTGVLVPKEFDDLRSAVAMASGNIAKWNAVWHKCFPATPAPPPYIEIAVSQAKAQGILQQLLASPAVSPWSSVEIKQSVINKALGALYCGLPLTEIEAQNNDASTILSTNLSTNLSTFDDPNDGSCTVPESCDDLGDMEQWTRRLKIAILEVDHDRVHDILRNSFDKVAVAEYSWLLELKALGLSTDEIADELLERAQHGPWIYSKINVHDVGSYFHDFHIPRCLHTRKEDETMWAVSLNSSQGLMNIETDRDNSIRETIGYWFGIGGVSPTGCRGWSCIVHYRSLRAGTPH
ncbi:hypothetical protein H9Q74_004113 [Fusarium xylarioides]|nr:hypothetical protein H9Q74_004113 [Fusarium xylarioides]